MPLDKGPTLSNFSNFEFSFTSLRCHTKIAKCQAIFINDAKQYLIYPSLQKKELRNAQLKADLEEEEEQMKKLWEDITVRWINQNTKSQEK